MVRVKVPMSLRRLDDDHNECWFNDGRMHTGAGRVTVAKYSIHLTHPIYQQTVSAAVGDRTHDR